MVGFSSDLYMSYVKDFIIQIRGCVTLSVILMELIINSILNLNSLKD